MISQQDYEHCGRFLIDKRLVLAAKESDRGLFNGILRRRVMIKRYSLIGFMLFSMFFVGDAAARTTTEPQAATIRIIANSQTIPDGQSIPLTVGQSVQLTVQLVDSNNSTTDITSAGETVYCSM